MSPLGGQLGAVCYSAVDVAASLLPPPVTRPASDRPLDDLHFIISPHLAVTQRQLRMIILTLYSIISSEDLHILL